jgi:hypothetical protein
MVVTLLTVAENLYEILNFDPSDRDTDLAAPMEAWAATISGRALSGAQKWWSNDESIYPLILLPELS